MNNRKNLYVFLILALIVGCFGSILYSSPKAEAKSIYFAGKYKVKGGKLVLNGYSSPESSAYGKNVGNFKFYGFKKKKKIFQVNYIKKGKTNIKQEMGLLHLL